MALFLVQHGKNLPKDKDPDKGLSPEGQSDVRRIAEVAHGYGVSVKKMLHSGKKRAQQTAEIMAEHLRPPEGVTDAEGLGATDDVAEFAKQVSVGDDAMLVGHLPFMEKMAAYLVTGDPERPIFKFQNGGILCLDHYPDTSDWVIQWALMPQIR